MRPTSILVFAPLLLLQSPPYPLFAQQMTLFEAHLASGKAAAQQSRYAEAVSYTHLTLPTILRV